MGTITHHFAEPGPANTEITLRVALERALDLDLSHAVVASVSGRTALALHEQALQLRYRGALVCVTHHVGWSKPNEDRMETKMRQKLRELGYALVTGTHALSGPERSFRNRFNGIFPLEMISETLRLFGQGVKVCVECAVMAADAGAVPVGRDVVVIAGTGEGADTACIISPANQHTFLDLKVREILAKPR